MGLAESRIIMMKLNTACYEADSQGRGEVKDLLSDGEFMTQLSAVWKQIPLASRKEIQKAEKRRSRKAPLQSTSPTVSNALLGSIPEWRADIKGFFDAENSLQLDQRHPIAGSYEFLLQLENRGERDTWRIRLLKVVFYRLIKRFCIHYKRSNHVERAIAITRKSGIVQDDPALVGTRITTWSDIGRRLDLLCREISDAGESGTDDFRHLGLLFCLPEYLTDNYLRKLPLQGPKRAQEITCLKERCLATNPHSAAIGDFACEAFNYLWRPIELCIVQEDFILQDGRTNNRQPSPEPANQSGTSERLGSLGGLSTSTREAETVITLPSDGSALDIHPQTVTRASENLASCQVLGSTIEQESTGESQTFEQIPPTQDALDQQPYIAQSLRVQASQFQNLVDLRHCGQRAGQTEPTSQIEGEQMDTSPDIFNPGPYMLPQSNLETSQGIACNQFSGQNPELHHMDIFNPIPYMLPPSYLGGTQNIPNQECHAQRTVRLGPDTFDAERYVTQSCSADTNMNANRETRDLCNMPEHREILLDQARVAGIQPAGFHYESAEEVDPQARINDFYRQYQGSQLLSPPVNC